MIQPRSTILVVLFCYHDFNGKTTTKTKIIYATNKYGQPYQGVEGLYVLATFSYSLLKFIGEMVKVPSVSVHLWPSIPRFC
jgi:hypothetical protein